KPAIDELRLVVADESCLGDGGFWGCCFSGRWRPGSGRGGLVGLHRERIIEMQPGNQARVIRTGRRSVQGLALPFFLRFAELVDAILQSLLGIAQREV